MKLNPENIEKIIPLIIEYLSKGKSRNKPVLNYLDHNTLKRELNLNIKQNGVSFEEIINEIITYLKFSVNTSHSQFFNQLSSGFNMPAFWGDLFSGLTNTTMATYEAAPAATVIEETLIRKMCDLIGYPEGEGIFVSGGSQANLIATLCARNNTLPMIKKTGFVNNATLKMFVSDQSHYSFYNAANILGIGTENLIKIKTNQLGQMMPDELESTIKKNIEAGNTPFFIGATAGTTVLGAFDPLIEIASIAKKYNIWYHIDACLGGSAILSTKYRYLLSGSELSDSLAWDPHKLMCIPLPCSVILIKNKGVLHKMCSASGADYLFHNDEDSSYDIGPMSLQCARRVDALKLWLSWKFYGDKGYDSLISNLFDMAKYAEQIILKDKRFELFVQRNSLTICFRYIPENNIDLNRFNILLRNQLYKKGKSFVNYVPINGNIVIRLAIINLALAKKDIEQFFNNLLSVAEEIERTHDL